MFWIFVSPLTKKLKFDQILFKLIFTLKYVKFEKSKIIPDILKRLYYIFRFTFMSDKNAKDN